MTLGSGGTPSNDTIQWILRADSSVLVLVNTSVGDAGAQVTHKETTTLADLLCSVARNRGITEARVIEHSLVGKVKAESFQKGFRSTHYVTSWDNMLSCVQCRDL